MIAGVLAAYNEAIFDTDRDRALKVVHDAVDIGVSPEDIVFKVVIPAMESVMKSVSESFEYNLAQHFLTSQIAAEVTEEMIPKFLEIPAITGRVIIGTSPGDMHGLGKRIVIGCLKALRMDVVDLGLNVAPERFVEEAVAHNSQIIGISSMMVHTARGENGCLKVRRILRERGLENRGRSTCIALAHRHAAVAHGHLEIVVVMSGIDPPFRQSFPGSVLSRI